MKSGEKLKQPTKIDELESFEKELNVMITLLEHSIRRNMGDVFQLTSLIRERITKHVKVTRQKRLTSCK